MPTRNLAILTLCQLISATGSIVMVTLGGIVGTTLADNPALATLPVSMAVIAMAAMTVPASLLMNRIGRRGGFALGSVSSIASMLLAALSMQQQSFGLFVVASALLGVNMAFTQQYRFAAAESVSSEFVGRAVSAVLLGSIGGALLGPELIRLGEAGIADVPFAGTFLVIAIMYAFQALALLALRPLHHDVVATADTAHRPLRVVVCQPVFVVAVLTATAGYGIMSFIMTATPISMHVNDGYDIAQTADVIRSHVLGMYVPSLVTGFLLDRFGKVPVMLTGTTVLIAAMVIGYIDRTYMHYLSTLVLLGIGWNFMYVGATTTLTTTYRAAERFRAQAVNEFSVFGFAALGSLLAGTVIYTLGWSWLILMPLPLLLIVLAGLYLVRKDPLLDVTLPLEDLANEKAV